MKVTTFAGATAPLPVLSAAGHAPVGNTAVPFEIVAPGGDGYLEVGGIGDPIRQGFRRGEIDELASVARFGEGCADRRGQGRGQDQTR